MSSTAKWESIMTGEELASEPPLSSSNGGRLRLMLTQREAAQVLSMSVDSFVRHVAPEIAMVRRGKLRLVPIIELERWIAESAVRVRGGR